MYPYYFGKRGRGEVLIRGGGGPLFNSMAYRARAYSGKKIR